MAPFFDTLKDAFVPVPVVKDAGNVTKTGSVPENSQSENVGAEKFSGEKNQDIECDVTRTTSTKEEDLDELYKGHVHRNLTERQLQMIAIASTLGVGSFLNTSKLITEVGPLSLLLGCLLWCIPVFIINVSMGEMVTFLPIPSPWLTLAERTIDDAFGFMGAWNFAVLQSSLIPFEVTQINSLLHYWRDDFSPAIPFACVLFGLFAINMHPVKFYGEIEFWLGLIKILICIAMILFTFIAMLGGNPKHDRFGFRYWETPMIEYIGTGSTGRFEGVLTSMIGYIFLIAGPEYISMTASELRNPRGVLPHAYKSVFYRIFLFFIVSAIAIGTCVSPSDPLLLEAINNGAEGAGSCTYTVAMKNLGIHVLPGIVNAILIIVAISGANDFVYCTSRTLYGMGINGKAPKFFGYCNAWGVPIYAVLAAIAWGCLSFLQLGTASATVLTWIINLVTASQLMNFMIMLAVYIQFYKCCKAQGIDREKFLFKGWFQPYLAWFGLAYVVIMIGVNGYYVFLPGSWSVSNFLFSYLWVFIDILLYAGWKLIKRTKFIKPEDADLVTGMDEVEAHERYLDSIGQLQASKRKGVLGKIINFFYGY